MLSKSTGLLVTLMVLTSCASTQPVEQSSTPLPEYDAGEVEAESLVAVGETVARIQFFVPTGESFHDLQLLLARAEDARPGDLTVEIRNDRLDRRFGRGRVSSFDAESNVPEWRSVEWAEPPTMEPLEKYAIVLLSEAKVPSWLIPTGPPGLYPWGDMKTLDSRFPRDLGFRASFTDGSILASEFAAGREVPVDLDLPKVESQYGIAIIGDGRPRSPRKAEHLPQCIGSRCADFSRALLPDPALRLERAAQAFEACLVSDFTLFEMTTPVTGISCRDVCKAADYRGCVGVAIGSPACDPSRVHRPARRPATCDDVVSSLASPDEVACACTNSEVHMSPLKDPNAIKDMISSNFVLGERNEPILREGAVPSGVTCAQICCQLTGKKCGKATYGKVVTPDDTQCGSCEPWRDGSKFNSRSEVVGDKIVTHFRGKAWLITPQTTEVESFEGPPVYSKRPRVFGNFVVWENHRGGQSTYFILDTTNAKMIRYEATEATSNCELGGHEGHLASVCYRGGQFHIEPIIGGGSVQITPEGDEGRIISWDGSTLLVSTSTHRLPRVPTRKGGYFEWKVGEKSWSKHSSSKSRSLAPDWSTAAILKELYERDPGAEGFVDGVYYETDNEGIWSFDPSTSTFRRWPTARRGRLVVSDGIIRFRSSILDPDSGRLYKIRMAPQAWLGRYALVDTKHCPARFACKELPEPFAFKSVVELDPRKLEPDSGIEAEIIEVAKP